MLKFTIPLETKEGAVMPENSIAGFRCTFIEFKTAMQYVFHFKKDVETADEFNPALLDSHTFEVTLTPEEIQQFLPVIIAVHEKAKAIMVEKGIPEKNIEIIL